MFTEKDLQRINAFCIAYRDKVHQWVHHGGPKPTPNDDLQFMTCLAALKGGRDGRDS
jgi:hypothetical protein